MARQTQGVQKEEITRAGTTQGGRVRPFGCND